MMRRLTKEELLKFDGTPLFPERQAHTARYELSDEETALYAAVTDYVRTEMNRVARFADVDNRKRVNVGFALQILQRRLASSPAAIHNSLKRRRERLQAELDEARLLARGRSVSGKLDSEMVSNEICTTSMSSDRMTSMISRKSSLLRQPPLKQSNSWNRKW